MKPRESGKGMPGLRLEEWMEQAHRERQEPGVGWGLESLL